MMKDSTRVRMNSAVMEILLIIPRLVMPMAIHRRISAPITMAHTQLPMPKISLVARAPS